MVCIRGKGKDHAKWSPVSTCFYRLLPSVKVEGSFTKEEAKEVVKSCPTGVFDIEGGKLKVVDERKCTTCRECIRSSSVKDKLKLGKKDKEFECFALISSY